MKKAILLLLFFSVWLLSCTSSKKAIPSRDQQSVRGLNYNSFVSFTAPSPALKKVMPTAWGFWTRESWDSLQLFINSDTAYGIYPPAQGFTNVDTMTLQAGILLDRFGWSGGSFVAPMGTPFCERALPAASLGKPYFVYKVVKPIHTVSAGKAIPWFGQKGMGVQYMFTSNVTALLGNGSLVAIDSVMNGKMDTTLLKGSAR